MPAAASVNKDHKNASMVSVWTIPEADPEDPVRWATGWAADVTWQRWLHWKSELGLPDELRSVELGCGYGKFSMLLGLAGAQATLFDYNPTALESAATAHATLRLSPDTVSGDLLNLPPEMIGSFDLSCSFGTLEHFFGDSRQAAITATASVLRPGGVMCISVPNRAGVWYRIGFGARYRLGLMADGMEERPFSRAELKGLAHVAGIDVLELEATGTFGGDFDYWIGENFKSLSRKLTGWPKRPQPPPPGDIRGRDIIRARELPPRSYVDRRFTYSLMLIGVKRQ